MLMGSKSDDGMLSTTCMTCAYKPLRGQFILLLLHILLLHYEEQSESYIVAVATAVLPTDHKGKPNFLLLLGVTPLL